MSEHDDDKTPVGPPDERVVLLRDALAARADRDMALLEIDDLKAEVVKLKHDLFSNEKRRESLLEQLVTRDVTIEEMRRRASQLVLEITSLRARLKTISDGKKNTP